MITNFRPRPMSAKYDNFNRSNIPTPRRPISATSYSYTPSSLNNDSVYSEFNTSLGSGNWDHMSNQTDTSTITSWGFGIFILLFVITMAVFVGWAVYTYIVDTSEQAAEQIEEEIEKIK